MKYLKVFDTTPEYNAFKLTENFILPNVSCTMDDLTVVYYNPYVAPIVQQHDYVEIGGVKWATMNIGATSITDYGLYFQWGDTQGYTADQVGEGTGKKYFNDDYIYYNGGSYTKYNEVDRKITLEPTDDAVKAAWGGNWRMPTVSEFIALGEAVDTAWTTDYQGSGVAGMICTDKTDSSKVLFFPLCGSANSGMIDNVGSYGYYLSSSLYTDDGYPYAEVYYSLINSDSVGWDYCCNRFSGCSVRGVLG